MALRDKLQSKYRNFGRTPPGWTGSGLGKVDSDPAGVLSGLGVSGFRGTGEDGLQDIFLLIDRAVQSPVLEGLYSVPTKRERNGEIELAAAADLYRFGNGAVMLRFIKAILAAADRLGLIALPAGLEVEPTASRTGVIIRWSGFAK